MLWMENRNTSEHLTQTFHEWLQWTQTEYGVASQRLLCRRVACDENERKNMRFMKKLVGVMLLCWASSSFAWMNIQFSVPGVSIGFTAPAYPQFAPVPGYPVYYAPNMGANYFYYNRMYWLYRNDNWYAAARYNGPWGVVPPMEVPGMILRVPVRYYRYPPAYFRGWARDEPPRWGERWGPGWQHRREGWDAGWRGRWHPEGHPREWR